MTKWKKITSMEDVDKLKVQDVLYEYPLGREVITTNFVEHKLHPIEDSKTNQINRILSDPHPTRNETKYKILILQQMMPYMKEEVHKSVTEIIQWILVGRN